MPALAPPRSPPPPPLCEPCVAAGGVEGVAPAVARPRASGVLCGAWRAGIATPGEEGEEGGGELRYTRGQGGGMPPGTQDPQLEDVLAEWMRAGIARVHTAFPATVVVYNPALQSATVQPVLRSRIDDPLLDAERPDIAPPPPIPNVPIVWPSGAAAAWSIHGPLLPGDPVLVVIAERETDVWRTTGAPDVAPLDARRFDLSDAFALPGGRHFNPTIPTSGPLPVEAVDPLALVLRGTLVKLGSGPAAIHPIPHGDLLVAALATFATACKLSTDPAVAAAAGTLEAALISPVGPPLSLVSFTE